MTQIGFALKVHVVAMPAKRNIYDSSYDCYDSTQERYYGKKYLLQ